MDDGWTDIADVMTRSENEWLRQRQGLLVQQVGSPPRRASCKRRWYVLALDRAANGMAWEAGRR